MAQDRLKIVWITGTSSQFGLLEEALKKENIEVFYLEPSSYDPKTDIQKWLSDHLPTTVHAVVLDGEDLRFLSAVMKARRALEHLRSRHVPWIWIYKEGQEILVEKLLEMGFDDFFSLRQDVHVFPLRLQLAIRHSHETASLVTQAQENSVRDAARETAIVQREEFLSVCAHDLRSPLGLVQSCLSLILNSHSKGLPAFMVELLTRARAQSQHAIRLVGDLLDVMSYEQGLKPQYEVIKLHELLTSFHGDYSLKAEEKGVGFHYDNEVPHWRILADSDRILQLFQNLFGNALKFTEKGKNIYLKVIPFQGRRKADPSYPMVIVSMQDEGLGIPQEQCKQIFNRFSQIKDYDRRGGRGLGLTVAKQISNLHAGNLWVNSEEGKGSHFNVLFPHVISNTEATDISKILNERKKKHILVVDASAARLKEHFQKIESWGYQVTYATDGVDAIVKAFMTLPDIVLLSPPLPQMKEDEVINTLRSDAATSHIGIILASSGDLLEKEKQKKTLVDQVLNLPFTKTNLSQIVKMIRKRQKEIIDKAA